MFFKRITKWVGTVTQAEAAAEVMRKAFKTAQTERPGATAVILPEDVSAAPAQDRPLKINLPRDTEPSSDQLKRAMALLAAAKNPIVLAGPGVARDHAEAALQRFAEALDLPVATTSPARACCPLIMPTRLAPSVSGNTTTPTSASTPPIWSSPSATI